MDIESSFGGMEQREEYFYEKICYACIALAIAVKGKARPENRP